MLGTRTCKVITDPVAEINKWKNTCEIPRHLIQQEHGKWNELHKNVLHYIPFSLKIHDITNETWMFFPQKVTNRLQKEQKHKTWGKYLISWSSTQNSNISVWYLISLTQGADGLSTNAPSSTERFEPRNVCMYANHSRKPHDQYATHIVASARVLGARLLVEHHYTFKLSNNNYSFLNQCKHISVLLDHVETISIVIFTQLWLNCRFLLSLQI